MASAGSIFVDLLLNDARYTQGWRRAGRTTRTEVGAVNREIEKATAAISRLGAIVASAFSVTQLIRYSDTWRQLEGRLSIVSGSMGEVAIAQERLFEIAQRTRQPLEGIISFYTRLAQFIPEAERAQYDLLGVTENVASALAITGETSASATAAMIQFTQAIGTNFEAAGQELRSLQEQAPRLTQALINAIGGGTKSLKQLKEEGKLSRESVLNALSGIGEEGRKLQDELAKVPLTVGQAFQQLDNAFLKFIGQNKLAQSGTSSFAVAVSALAENIEVLAGALAAIALIIGARYTSAFITATAQTIANQVAMANAARQAALTSAAYLGVGTAAASASSSVSLLTRALAVFGGPIGAAITAVGAAMLYLATQTSEAEKKQQILNETLTASADIATKLEASNLGLSNASASYTVQLSKENNELKRNAEYRAAAIRGLIVQQEIQLKLANQNLSQLARSPRSVFFLDKINDEQERSIENLKQLEGLYASLNRLESAVSGVGASGGGGAIGVAGKVAASQADVSSQTAKATEKLKEQGEQIEKNSGFAQDFGFTFNSALEDAIVNGKKFSDVLEGLAQDIQRIIVRKTITEPIGQGISDFISSSNIGGIFDGFFADGGYIKPGHFGIAGEAGAEMVYGGKAGATVIPQGAGKVNINIINNNNSSVNTSSTQNANGIDITVTIDQMVANNINRPGTATNRALTALRNQSLARR